MTVQAMRSNVVTVVLVNLGLVDRVGVPPLTSIRSRPRIQRCLWQSLASFRKPRHTSGMTAGAHEAYSEAVIAIVPPYESDGDNPSKQPPDSRLCGSPQCDRYLRW